MHWFGWTLLILWVLNIFVTIASIGEPRKPRTAGDAIAALIITMLLTWMMVQFSPLVWSNIR
jgi:hypothetical protein